MDRTYRQSIGHPDLPFNPIGLTEFFQIAVIIDQKNFTVCLVGAVEETGSCFARADAAAQNRFIPFVIIFLHDSFFLMESEHTFTIALSSKKHTVSRCALHELMRLSSELCLELVLQSVKDLVMNLCDFFILEGVVACLICNSQGNRLLAFTDSFAFIDIEDFDIAD